MEDAQRKFLAEFICESDAIESIQDDVGLLERQLKRKNKRGHAGAMLWLESLLQNPSAVDCLMSKDLICRVQGLITAEQHLKPGGQKLPKRFVGDYRTVGMRVGERICPDSKFVPDLMYSLTREIREWKKNIGNMDLEQKICGIADFHFFFEQIHPFADGNGRTGRALVWYLLKYSGLQPFIFTSWDRWETYYLCFEEYEAMRRYFLKKMGFGIQTVSC